MKIEDTYVEEVRFGESPEEIFYCLVDRSVSPDGLNIEKMRLTDPRNFDQRFRELGCVAMLTGMELEELIRRNLVREDFLHEDLFRICRQENILD